MKKNKFTVIPLGSKRPSSYREDHGAATVEDEDEIQDDLLSFDGDIHEDESIASQDEWGNSGLESESLEDDQDIDDKSGDNLTLREKYLAPTDSEDDDFERPATTIGNIPVEWYEDYPHIGYDLDGKHVVKPATKDELDALLQRMDDPAFMATFNDTVQHKDVTLTNDELEIIKKLQTGHYPHADFDPYPEYDEPFVSQTMVEPLSAAPEPKRRFIRSKWEHTRIMKIVRAIRKGLIMPKKPKKQQKERFYDIWDQEMEREPNVMHISAPKLKLPDHSESYHPPEEYLPNNEEKEQWLNTDAEDRENNYLPQSHDNLRSVAAYPRFIQERFARCLDLYLCPRTVRKRVVDPESLLPKLPDPKDLEPFPKYLAITYNGHEDKVRSISVDPTGQWLVSGSDDKSAKLWEVQSGKCLQTWIFDDTILSVAWNPNKNLSLVALAVGKLVHIVNPGVCTLDIDEATESLMSVAIPAKNEKSKCLSWQKPSDSQRALGIRAIIPLLDDVDQVTWHKKGDYFATVSSESGNKSVLVHQLSKHQSQSPFSKASGLIQKVLFHPSKPLFFVASQKYVRVYNLLKQELERKLVPGVKWISSMDIHPGGDNLIIGTYDKKTCWFDLDLGTQPYQVLRSSEYAVRDVSFHHKYPLFAACGDDGKAQIFHGMVYNDYMQNALIVPVRKLETKQKKGGLGVLCCEFHPSQPWLFTSGADGTVKLFS